MNIFDYSHIKKYVCFFTILSGLLQCLFSKNTNSFIKEGYVKVEGGNIWYQVIGNGTGTPLLLIHGGPGGLSCWHAPFKALGNDRKVIFYDQLDSGHSEHPADTTFWNLSHFVGEIDSLRKALDLKQILILGHSWGGAVAIEYMISQKPKGVQAVVFAAPLLSSPRWEKDAKQLCSQLPVSIQQILVKHEAAGTTDSKEYLAAADSFYARFLYHKHWPPILPNECDGLSSNNEIYMYMWGPSEFHCSGKLREFDRTDCLGDLSIPVLFIGGEFDEIPPSTLKFYQRLVSNSKLAIIKDAGHMAMIDQPDEYIKVLRRFLQQVDNH